MNFDPILINLDAEVSAEFRRALGPQGDTLRESAHPTGEDFVRLLDGGSSLVVAVQDAGRLDLRWWRELRERWPEIQLILACRECGDETWRRWILAGARNVLRPPFHALDLETEFSAEPAVHHLFRRHPTLHTSGKVMFRYAIPSDAEYIPGVVHVVALMAMEFGFSRADYSMNLPLAIDEALSNAIIHGNRRDPRKHVEVEGQIDGHTMRLKVCDQGEGIRRDPDHDPVDPSNLLAPGGRGLFLIESVMDEVRYSPEGRCIEMVKRCTREEGGS